MNKSQVYHLQKFLVTAMWVVLIAVTCIAVLVQAVNHVQNREQAQQAAAEMNFWLVMAGEADGTAPTVENQLALDLRTAMADDGALRSFRGDANAYGGISDEIGYSPFHDESCNECGALTPEMLRKIKMVRDGDVDKVLATVNTDIDTRGYTTTTSGTPVWLSLVLAYLIFGLVAFYVARLMEGPNTDEDFPAVYAISPIGAFISQVNKHRVASSSERAKRQAFPDYMDLMDRADRQAAEMPPGEERDKLVAQRNRIAAEVEEQMSRNARNRSSDELAALQVELEVSTSFMDDVDEAEDAL